MADDLSRLQMLAKYAQIRNYVKVICLEDDSIKVKEGSPLESSAIWPRHKDGQVVAESIGVGLLKSMLATKQLRPVRLEIRDTPLDESDPNTFSNPETAAVLARNILIGADLAVTDFVLKKGSAMTTIITAELSTENQGQGIGFSILHKAQLCLSHNLNSSSYWADQIFLHAPVLKELSLSFSQPHHMLHTPSFFLNNKTFPSLEKLELSMSRLSILSIMAILSNSKQSLTGISFHLVTLGNDSTWAELLSRICNDFAHLTWFKLTNLSEGPMGELRITFPDLDRDSVVGEPYKKGLKLVQRRPVGAPKRIPGVEYVGADANHVLNIVAEHTVAASVP